MNSVPSDNPTIAALAEAHTTVNARHDAARASLLASLASDAPVGPRRAVTGAAWRYVAGAMGLAAAAAVAAMALWPLAASSPAAAMEQTARALDRVGAYSYHMEKVYVSRKDEGRTLRHTTLGRWRTAPLALYGAIRIVETVGTNTDKPGEPKTLVDVEEAHQANRGGILVDHLTKTYWRIDEEIDADSIPPDSPQTAIFMVRQRRYRVVCDLGERQIDGRRTRGVEIVLEDAQPESELGLNADGGDEGGDGGAPPDWRNMTFEVWIDPDTDLPAEFRGVRRGADFETTYLFTDLQWNVEFPAEGFEVDLPEDYTELDGPPRAEEE
jgi:hypothetical protein